MTRTVLTGLLVVVLSCACVQTDSVARPAHKITRLVERLCREYATQGYPNSNVPLEGYCNVYVHCGVTNTLKVCPVGTFFDRHTCVDSSQSYCPHDPCIGKPDGHQYSDGETCHGFYVCLDDMSFYRKCYDGYSFQANTCVHDRSCNSQVVPVVSGCDDNQYLASPDFPGVYFQRVPGGNYLKRPCPEGLVFDTSVCVCNYPKNYYSEHQTHKAGNPDKGHHWGY
ncbi:uncharacterized protein [Littorina saxatilis]|uniref:Chitin-binding type-2 domain-containing protein n=1 Tax=Littorina saxatilis TaxID=31220 RepID=A0AAN9BSY9_9CAEN